MECFLLWAFVAFSKMRFLIAYIATHAQSTQNFLFPAAPFFLVPHSSGSAFLSPLSSTVSMISRLLSSQYASTSDHKNNLHDVYDRQIGELRSTVAHNKEAVILCLRKGSLTGSSFCIVLSMQDRKDRKVATICELVNEQREWECTPGQCRARTGTMSGERHQRVILITQLICIALQKRAYEFTNGSNVNGKWNFKLKPYDMKTSPGHKGKGKRFAKQFSLNVL